MLDGNRNHVINTWVSVASTARPPASRGGPIATLAHPNSKFAAKAQLSNLYSQYKLRSSKYGYMESKCEQVTGLPNAERTSLAFHVATLLAVGHIGGMACANKKTDLNCPAYMQLRVSAFGERDRLLSTALPSHAGRCLLANAAHYNVKKRFVSHKFRP